MESAQEEIMESEKTVKTKTLSLECFQEIGYSLNKARNVSKNHIVSVSKY